jgi:hypothetical protein
MRMTHDPDRVHLSPAVRASRSSDGLVLLDLRGGCVLASNDVGARIWELLEQRRGLADIAAQIARDYDIPAARATADVAAFIAALLARGVAEHEVTR